MIITLSGVTGVGKSYLKNIIRERLNLENLIVVTTRSKRNGETDGKDKYFISKDEYDKKRKTGEISVTFNFLGSDYAYYTKELLSDKNSITELHYTTITEFNKVAKDVLSIYMIPSDVNIAIEQLKKRKLPEEVEEKRIREIKEQLKEVESNSSIIKEFDYIIENNYTDEVVDKIIKIITNNLLH